MNVRKTDWDSFRKDLQLSIDTCPSRARTVGNTELMANAVHAAIINTYESNCPLTVRQGTKAVSWWNKYESGEEEALQQSEKNKWKPGAVQELSYRNTTGR